jgi:hypothetical protein
MTAINHYVNYLTSEIEFYEREEMLDDTEYQGHKTELPEVYALLNWIKLEYSKNEN